MKRYLQIVLVVWLVALIAAIFGFTDTFGPSSFNAKVVFFIFVFTFVTMLIMEPSK